MGDRVGIETAYGNGWLRFPSPRAKSRFSASSFCALTLEDGRSLAAIAREANIFLSNAAVLAGALSHLPGWPPLRASRRSLTRLGISRRCERNGPRCEATHEKTIERHRRKKHFTYEELVHLMAQTIQALLDVPESSRPSCKRAWELQASSTVSHL
jgi:hypothetical protein